MKPLVKTSAASTPGQVTSVLAELGRCLLLYQSIEQVLKLYLPHVRATEEEALKNVNVDWRELLDSKKTLGALFKLFQERTSVSNSKRFADQVHILVEERNEVVHHFYEASFSPLRTRAQVAEALQHLHLRAASASRFLSIVQTHAMIVLSDDPTLPGAGSGSERAA